MKMKKILVTGRFNVLHPGHIRLLRFAKECGDVLIVGVESDLLSGKEAHVPEDLRLEGILSNSLVDEAYIIRNSVEMFIEEIKPNILVKGKEHENAFNPEIAVLKKFGGKLLFSSGETFFSSIDLLNKEEKTR
jgi:cytidyltransferase-like protein